MDFFGYVLYHVSEDERRVAWGDLHGALFRVSVVTYLLSTYRTFFPSTERVIPEDRFKFNKSTEVKISRNRGSSRE
jgi:hypothetical protein